jgi:lipoprotein-anchoring transpeptidase ErfK/SrfK
MKKIIIAIILVASAFLTGYTYTKSKMIQAPPVQTPSSSSKAVLDKPEQTKEKDKTPQSSDTNNTQASKDKVSDGSTKASGQTAAKAKTTQTTKTGSSGKNQATKEAPSSKGYSVKVDISKQRTYVYKDGTLIKTMICSTGIENASTRTPRGSYIINQSGVKKGEWFYSSKYEEGAKYWVGFIGGTYLFHSVPMDANKNIIQSEAEKLGTPASHGCIRLSVQDAYWFYKNIPSGAKLVIQD